ncbi:MAG: AAA family ATPase [Desulfosporosinus sp.]|nr:AAA family ATPase [Desulfosporosinus sp.]
MAEDWLSKYTPRTTAQILSNQGAKTALLGWLQKKTSIDKHSALITGPPGCGKTLLARLACKEAGMANVLEINSNNKRSAKTIKALKEAFSSERSVLSYYNKTKPGAIIIDEIDNCDQGGMTELTKYIRTSKLPVICIADEAYNKALKPLASSSLLMRLNRPPPEQIANLLLYICTQEQLVGRLNIGSAKALAAACNCDVRQCILELYMATRSVRANLSIQRNEDGLVCDKPLGPFEILAKLFAGGPRNIGLLERLHTMDRSLVPLMVAENYVKSASLQKDLDRLVAVSDSISIGNVLEGGMLKHGAWDVQDTYAHFATIRPAALCSLNTLSSQLIARAEFPAVLSRMSTTKKMEGLIRDMALRITATPFAQRQSASSVALELMDFFRFKFVGRLALAGPKVVASEMNEYSLDKTDWDLFLSTAFSKETLKISAAGKAALTKAFSTHRAKRARSVSTIDEEEEEEEDQKRPRYS